MAIEHGKNRFLSSILSIHFGKHPLGVQKFSRKNNFGLRCCHIHCGCVCTHDFNGHSFLKIWSVIYCHRCLLFYCDEPPWWRMQASHDEQWILQQLRRSVSTRNWRNWIFSFWLYGRAPSNRVSCWPHRFTTHLCYYNRNEWMHINTYVYVYAIAFLCVSGGDDVPNNSRIFIVFYKHDNFSLFVQL